MVGVAQLVEPRIVIPVVVGSSPIARPIFLWLRLDRWGGKVESRSRISTWASSSIWQSSRLLIYWLGVRVPRGPPDTKSSAGRCFFVFAKGVPGGESMRSSPS